MTVPLRLGLPAHPVFVFLILGSQKGAVGKFIKAGANAPETARRPSSLDANTDQVADAVKSRVLITTGDGRYYVDLSRYRRRRITLIAWFAGGGILLTFLVAWLTWPHHAP